MTVLGIDFLGQLAAELAQALCFQPLRLELPGVRVVVGIKIGQVIYGGRFAYDMKSFHCY